jgi:5-formyltetrahydrofolate cyclo-ligase
MGKQVYLPILAGNPQEHLVFAPYRSDTKLKPNRFGIPEPQIGNEELLTPQYLDLVLTPLVAFDASGTRLGMGGGFYDRTFAFLNHPGHFSKPRLFGLAYELQRVDHLPRQPWDVPLQGIITERAFYSNGDNCVSK